MSVPELNVDTTGNPRVEVFFDPVDLPVEASTLRVYRLSDDREWLVRGGVDVAVGTAVLDYEVPFQTVSMYRAEMFDVSGVSLGFTDAGTVTLDYTGTVVHQPLSPVLRWASVKLLEGSGSALTRPTPGQTTWAEGDVVGTWIGSRRQGLRGTQVSVLAEGDEADKFQSIFGDYETQQLGIVCIRTSDAIRWPRTFFARGDFAEADLDVKHGGSAVALTATVEEVKPPFPGVTTPLLTYSDWSAAFGLYSGQSAAFASYTDVSRAYEYAGLAG